MNFLNELGNRKLVVTVIILIAGAITVALKGDIPPHFQTFLEVLFGGFVVGNGVEHIMNTHKIKYEKAATTEVVAPPPADLTQVEASLAKTLEGVVLVQQLLQFIIQKTGLDKQPPAK